MEITVVIPTKDRWPLLLRSVRSALAQEDVELEVIVVDDGSKDGTLDRLAGLGDPRLRILRHDQSKGVASARNLGVESARGEWIAFLDDDDLWAPWKLRVELDRTSDGAQFIYTGMVVIDDELGPIQVRAPEPENVRQSLVRYNLVGAPSTVMVRTDLVRCVRGFDERLSALADWDLWLRLILDERAVLAACPEPLVAYTLHTRNMHRAEADSIMAEFRHLAAKHRREGRPVGGPSLFRWVAASQRRSGRRGQACRTYVESAVRYGCAGDLARGVGVLLGERAMALGRRPTHGAPSDIPAWVSRQMAA